MKKLLLLFVVLLTGLAASAENYILYTSSNGQVVEPYKTDVFGVNIVSNTYENGQGKIMFDGEITVIGEWAFYECSGLTSLEIPNSVTTIGQTAFNGCTGLTSITLPKGITTIYPETFKNCSSLASITIPDKVTTIGDLAFFGCAGLTSVEIPESVTEIGKSAFACDSTMTSITIPNSVKTIGSSAFSSCYRLKSVVVPNSLTSLGSYAFKGCIDLEDIKIGDSVQAIESRTFYDCRQLKSVKIPISVKSIGGEAFKLCRNLTTVIIGDSVTLIDYRAFEGCENLTTINIPNSVTRVSSNVFTGCTSLPVENGIRYADTYAIEAIDKTQTTYTLKEDTRFIGESAFSLCTNMTSIKLPDHLLSIGMSAFFNCSSLAAIELPNSLTRIDGGAFQNCSSLKSIKIPDSVTDMDAGMVFFGTEILNAALYNSRTFFYLPRNHSGAYTIPDGTKAIASRAFNTCLELTEITIPESVETIGGSAFSNCYTLKSVNIPNSVQTIGSSAFYSCYQLKTVTLPNALTTIESSTFDRDTSLVSIHIPDNVTRIGGEAFQSCINLTSINLPNALTTIESSTFARCSRLASIEIPNSVTQIAKNAFYRAGLTAVTIPNSVERIESEAFRECSSLTSITFGNGLKYLCYDAFRGCKELEEIHIYDLSAWCCHPSNVEFGSIINQSGSIKEKRLYVGDKHITDLVIPDDVNRIDNKFDRFDFKTVDLGHTLKSVDGFNNCEQLTSVVIPASVEELSGFSGCTNMKKVDNYSKFFLRKGTSKHGYVAYYADEVINHHPFFEVAETESTYAKLVPASEDISDIFSKSEMLWGSEQFDYDKSSLMSSMPPTEKHQVTAFNRNPAVTGQLHNDDYVEYIARTTSSHPQVAFRDVEILAGKYDIEVVIVPENIADASNSTPKRNKFNARIQTSDNQDIYATDDDGKYAIFLSDPTKVDTLLLFENMEIDVNTTLYLEVVMGIADRKTVTPNLNIDCIILTPKKTYECFGLAPADDRDGTILPDAEGNILLTDLEPSTTYTFYPFHEYKGERTFSDPLTFTTADPAGIKLTIAKPIDPNAPMYNLQGQKVGPDYKGIVIQNGRKYLLK